MSMSVHRLTFSASLAKRQTRHRPRPDGPNPQSHQRVVLSSPRVTAQSRKHADSSLLGATGSSQAGDVIESRCAPRSNSASRIGTACVRRPLHCVPTCYRSHGGNQAPLLKHCNFNCLRLLTEYSGMADRNNADATVLRFYLVMVTSSQGTDTIEQLGASAAMTHVDALH